MKPRFDLAAMQSLFGHPRRGDLLVGLLTCCAAGVGFWLGAASSGLDHQRRSLTVLARKCDAITEPSDEVWRVEAMDSERIRAALVEDVGGARVWAQRLREAAAEAGLGIRFRWGDSVRPTPVRPDVEHVGLVIELDSSSAKQGATARMQGFLQQLDSGRPPFELGRLRWTGAGRGLSGVVVEGRLWIRRSVS